MRYSLLRVTDDGVVLSALHERRLAPDGGEDRAAFARFAAEAEPGVWAVRVEGGALRCERRGLSRLWDGMPARHAVSPCAGMRGTFPKPAPPCVYDGVRAEGVATLLTWTDEAEILESCSAAVLGWDGERFLCVPEDRPRVWSTAEQAVRAHLSFREERLAVGGDTPLLLVNAVKGPCTIAAPGRRPFPPQAIRDIEELFARLTERVG